MKVALSCDHLISRNQTTQMLDLLCEIFPEADIYTFVHQQGQILGHVELKRIYSSYLSHFVTSEKSYSNWKFLLPTLSKNFKVPQDVDCLVSLSSGLGHGIPHYPTTKHISYLYSLEEEKGGAFFKPFQPFVQNWQKQSLRGVDYLIFSSMALKSRWDDTLESVAEIKNKVIPPVFKYKDFPLAPESIQERDRNYYVANTEGVSKKDLEHLCDLFSHLKIPLKLYGTGEGKKSNPWVEYSSAHCSGELAVLFQGARAAIDLSHPSFPHFALGALSSGRPVIATHHPENLEFLPSQTGFFFQEEKCPHSLKDLILKMEHEFSWFEPKLLRNFALKYHDMAFRRELKKVVEEVVFLH